MNKDVDSVIRRFAAFLAEGYEGWLSVADLSCAASDEERADVFDDWAQANWELLVERPLLGVGEFLEIYGAGSDYECGSHSRVFFRDVLPTHRISVSSAGGGPVKDVLNDRLIDLAGYRFERFVSLANGQRYESRPPFDCVLFKCHEHGGQESAVIMLSQVRFELVPIQNASSSRG